MSRIPLTVKAIIFDMDGVITNTMPDHYKAWKKIFAQQGVIMTKEDVYCREGQKGIQSVTEILFIHGKTVPRSQAEVLLEQKEKIFKEIVRQRFICGARQFLRDLHRRSFRLALVTGTSRHELLRILPESLLNLFEVTITGNDVRHGKPHPEPFQRALQRLGLKAQEAVVLENAPFGIQSAKAAGLRTLAIETSLPKKYLHQADMIFPSIKEIKERVVFLLDGSA